MSALVSLALRSPMIPLSQESALKPNVRHLFFHSVSALCLPAAVILRTEHHGTFRLRVKLIRNQVSLYRCGWVDLISWLILGLALVTIARTCTRAPLSSQMADLPNRAISRG
jgi:hypothetical protein